MTSQRQVNPLTSTHLLHEACTCSEHDTAESLLSSVAENLAPGDLTFCAFPCDSSHHDVEQVPDFRVINWFGDQP